MATYSVTERLSHDRCSRQHGFGSFNRMAIEPIHPPIYYDTGSLWHRGQELWCKSPETSLNIHVYVAANELKARTIKAYTDDVGVAPGEDELAQVYEAVNRITDLSVKYEAHWHSPLPDEFHLLDTEQTIVVPVPGTMHYECDLCNPAMTIPPIPCAFCSACQTDCWQPHYLEGTLDGLLEGVMNRKLYILERKTYAQRPNLRLLNNTEQFLDYMWLVTNGLPDRELGGMLYDGAWVTQAEHKLSDLFLRTTLHRPKYEIEHHTQTLAIRLNEMWADDIAFDRDTQTWQPHPVYNRVYRGCYDCSFDELCEAFNKGNNWQAIMKQKFHPRRKQGYALEVAE